MQNIVPGFEIAWIMATNKEMGIMLAGTECRFAKYDSLNNIKAGVSSISANVMV